MDTQPQHNPRTKCQLKDVLYAYLYSPVEKQFKDRLAKIIVKNTVLIKATHKSFVYRGEVYNMDLSPLPRKANRLAPELEAEMDIYLEDKKTLNEREIPFVIGFITTVLNSSNDMHDYLALLPSALHPPIQRNITSCPCRTRHLSDEEVKAIRTNNEKLIDIIKGRMTTNLLYS